MVAFTMAQVRGQGVSWIWLGLFGVVHGLNEWADMIVPALGESMVLMCVRSLLLILSFLFLFEFGRRNVIWSGGGRVGRWIYMPLLALLGAVAFHFGYVGMLSSARYVLAFPGGLLAAMALWQWGTPPAEKKRNFLHRLAALAMAGYAVLAGLVAPRMDFGLAAIFNADAFMSVTGMPIQLFRCGMACIIALVIWREHYIWRREWFSGAAITWIVRLERGAGLVVLMILFFGFVAVSRVQQVAEEEARAGLQSGHVLAVLGVDQADARFGKSLLQKRLLPLLITALLALLIMLFTVIWLRVGEEAQLKTLSLLRAQHQQETLWKLADSITAIEGNSISAWQRISEEAGRGIKVDHVGIMFIDSDKQEFHMEDRFDVARGLHSAGEVVSGKNYEALKGVLEEGRALAVDEVVSDGRISGLKAWCLEAGSLGVLFAPFKGAGKASGLILFSQKGAGRKWLSDEVRFASEVANLVSRCLVNSERDRAEKALSKAHDELEVRIGERTEQLFQKNKQLTLEIQERKRLEAERDSLEAQVRQAQKMESLGVMAGGIAHDFNNILMAILGNAELARMELPPGTPVSGYIQDIERSANRAAVLSTQMLVYSGRAFIQIQAVDLNTLIRDMSGILEAAVSRKVTLLYNLDKTLKTLDGDSSQIGQILVNLVINATEAIGDEAGVITLQTGTLWCDAGMLVSLWVNEAMPEGEYVYLEVRDTGCGMEPELLPQIFDPFFTTKFTGRGLGLAAVIGIVRGHRGTILVSSETKQGTLFRLLFPVGQLAFTPPEKSVERDRRLGHGTILLVDDEEQVRALGVKFIERLGYRVVEAVDGFDAIEKFKQNQSDIRCVLMDLTMPQCDGYEALLGLRKLDPAVKVILCSGYIKEDVLTRYSDLKTDGFLHKPYGSDELARQVEATLKGGNYA
jgi:signal transduction histidine kinase/CheY-like chemotaxis protein